MNIITTALMAAKVIELLAAGDDLGVVGALADYAPDERHEILDAALGAGADPAKIAALREMLGGTEVIEVHGKPPSLGRRLSPWLLAGIVVAGTATGMYAQARRR